jgi:hypothetical protein
VLKIDPGWRMVGFDKNAPEGVFNRLPVRWLVRVTGVRGVHCWAGVYPWRLEYGA